jgi:DnaJ-class molecular chaperone
MATHSSCEVTRCLQDASEQLQKALDRQSTDSGADDETMIDDSVHASVAEHETNDNVQNAMEDHDDPDDLAAAFFAQQSKRKEAEMKLPVDEWAKVIRQKKKLVGEGRFLQSKPRRKSDSKTTTFTITLIICLSMLLFGFPTLAHAAMTDPYKVLGVTRNASQKEIQKQYRKQCLKYHPDKTGHLSPQQRKTYEEQFKKVQEAYDMITNPDSQRYRQQYPFTGAGSTPYGSDPVAEAFFRAFDMDSFRSSSSPFFYRSTSRGPSFGFRSPFPNANNPPPTPSEVSFKSIYVQKVKVPLEKLYKGTSGLDLQLKDNLWTRYKAAWKGKILYLSLYQGLMYSLPVLRMSKFGAAVVGLFIMHSTLPRPDPEAEYACSLRPGTKGGQTKIKFASTSYGKPEIIFEVEEQDHPLYYRVENDLHTTITISSQEAKEGCIKRIRPLDPATEEPIKLALPPKQYSYKKQKLYEEELKKRQKGGVGGTVLGYNNTVRIPGRGWPTRNGDMHGDLVVTVLVEKPSRRRKWGL